MAELKAYKIVLSTESETVGSVVYSRKVYDQADVDKYIADLQSEIERLKKSQESSSKIFDHVNEERIECQKENFIIKRTLWLARAERAKERKIHFDNLDYFGISVVTINFESARTWMTCKTEKPSKWAIIFEKVEQKCRAKAEEYK